VIFGTRLLRRRNSQANPLMWLVGGEVTQRIANPCVNDTQAIDCKAHPFRLDPLDVS
jgi:hypothetical protein